MTPEPDDDAGRTAAGVDSAVPSANAGPGNAASSPSSSATDNENGDLTEMAEDHNDHSSNGAGSGTKAKPGKSNGTSAAAANAKDPTRPRRKKARRACFACQRAHLTCGDERPCQRCVKRGLQDSCHDGMRKKAKYLHDAPNEALMPGVPAGHYARLQHVRGQNAIPGNSPTNDSNAPVGHQGGFFPANQPPPTSSYGIYNGAGSQGHMPPQLQDYGAQPPPPISPSLPSGHSQHSGPLSTLPNTLPQSAPASNQNQPPNSSYGEPMFDPSNPGFFNFDIASLNFGNRYGAMEFGMLNHMSSGATDPSLADSSGTLPQNSSGYMGNPSVYSQSPGSSSYGFGQDSMDWQGGSSSRHGSASAHYKNGGDMPGRGASAAHGYTIATGSMASPSSTSSPQGLLTGFDGSPMSTFYAGNPRGSQSHQSQQPPQQQQQQQAPPQQQQQQQQQPQPPPVNHPSQNQKPRQVSRSSPRNEQRGQNKRSQGPSSIYETVKHPYSYTTGFHGLTACLQRRFSPQKTLRIAKALASIRPSFISSTKNLNMEDLIFMEKCFQRTLWEYENDFINACGTPTIVCRRTGEVAAVGKEFSLLTGWRKDILLGKEANLNVNTGGTSGRASAGTSSGRGFNTPRIPELAKPPGDSRPQPVFLAELLDDDSVIDFYEDFSKLAFGDSRGSATHRCKLLRYKTKEDVAGMAGLDDDEAKPEDQQGHHVVNGRTQSSSKRSSGSFNARKTESGINGLESQDGKVECSYCWTVKRDVFDIPMLIVMNFLPCI